MSGGPDVVSGPTPPPAPPTRGPSSYNGVRTGSFASFGHIYPHDPRVFGNPLQQVKDNSLFISFPFSLSFSLFLGLVSRCISVTSLGRHLKFCVINLL